LEDVTFAIESTVSRPLDLELELTRFL